MSHATETSVVIPVYGSASILPSLVERLESSLTQGLGAGTFEVILVHDCGPDNAWDVIGSLVVSRPWLRGIDLRRNAGQHNAIMAGLSVARGDYVVTMDDDLQHDPNDVLRIIEALRQGADLVYAQFTERHHALWKRAGSVFNDVMAQWLLKKPKNLYLSPFRGFVGALRDQALRYHGPFVYLDGLLLQSTRLIATITVNHHARSDGRSGYSVRKSISLWLQMATSFSIVPLRLISLTGALVSVFAFIVAIIVLVQKLSTPALPIGWASLIVTILLMGGLQLLALGAIGEYTGRILLNVNNRPQFVIGRVLNLDTTTP